MGRSGRLYFFSVFSQSNHSYVLSICGCIVQIRKNWIKHGKILSLVKINSAKTQLTQFSLSCCQRADFSVLSQKRWDKLALFYKHNTNPNENSQFKHWFYIRSYRVKLNSSVAETKSRHVARRLYSAWHSWYCSVARALMNTELCKAKMRNIFWQAKVAF